MAHQAALLARASTSGLAAAARRPRAAPRASRPAAATKPSAKRSRRARCAANGGGGVQQGASGKAELQSHSERMASSSLLGDIGARDAFEAETMSNFGENVLGNSDTEHEILIPNVRKLDRNSLMNTPCSAEGAAKAIVGDESEVLLKQLNLANLKVWEVNEAGNALERTWVCRTPDAAADMGARFEALGEAQGHAVMATVVDEDANTLTVRCGTPALGSPSFNDFALAAKIEETDVSDLIKKVRKMWA